ncbi:MAG TPA: Ni/Fe hydrogenase subunit alpha [Calditrichia bacterium]|nr:Ni/Fe hydrogenase subunit alpha [Calditrichia bacterium]
MSKTITINNVTRIEGHAKITLHLDDQGMVQDAQFHVTQFRGFEKLCEGRPFYEMPSLMARICGICPVSHLLASAKACDDLMAVAIPKTAIKLRKILNMAQIMQSHALSFFHLSAPDLLLGMDGDPASRNIFGLMKDHAQLVQDGIQLRKIGQEIIALLGGKRIHPSWVVPGGVNKPLSEEHRDQILASLGECRPIIHRTLEIYKSIQANFKEEIQTFANFPSLFLGLVSPGGNLEFYDGNIRVADAARNTIADQIDTLDFNDYLEESVEKFSYLKSPYYKAFGYPDGIYRVGPLARLNIIDRCGTPQADEEWAEFQGLQRGAVLSSFYFHYPRLIEVLFCAEMMERLLQSKDILDPHVRAYAKPNSFEGIGVCEAPRGTLMHHYRINKNGKIEWANLVIATGHNNLAMNRGVLQTARHFVKGEKIEEGMLNRVEAVIRAFDPCLSCSTHAVGQMPLNIELLSASGTLLDSVKR